MGLDQRFHSLEDFVASHASHVDGVVDCGDGSAVPIKGVEIEAAILFADISGFSTRTIGMSPVETLIYVQTFFGWITSQALRGRPGIVDKYIGDEAMVIFSKDFGSAEPVTDAIQAAVDMVRNDPHAYRPHVDIAFGRVIAGFAGTPLRYNVSVFGRPVALAARCAGIKPDDPEMASPDIALPDSDWGGRSLDDFSTPGIPESLKLSEEARSVALKGVGEVSIREIFNEAIWVAHPSAEDRTREALEGLRSNNRYWPR
ncbi:adenylate/guanylate cyclase domain-containing protein [Actinoplanes couchii]|uniref:Adenylate cyclase n=1 Tax=Actinoplanes couchii TaxID=403638 RepID=A0ABQ3XTW4_9ACTN|nr:adenylate/guanylate cyclase domain-containing protein [Actinoplanes couchii]MDR6319004.1 hypothetical protein [Actinoplanes couchii]GID61971.1 adenylate cyclase [Actinoplanes couchii]